MPVENPAQMPIQSISVGWQHFESSPDCVKLLSQDGRVVAMNENGLCAMEIDDFSRVSGALWKSFWPSVAHEEIDAAMAAALAGGAGHFKALCPTAKGADRWWDVLVTPVVNPGDSTTHLLAISRDVTAAHLAESAMHASEARFRSLVMATSATVWRCPASGAFETEQPAWGDYTGQSFDQYRHFGWLDAVHPDDRAGTTAAWAHAVDTNTVYQYRHRLRNADGRYRDMAIKAVPVVDVAGAVTEWVGTHTDVTGEVRATEERERLLRELQLANDRMHDIFRQAPAFMCVMNGPEHTFELVNDRYLQLVGNRDLIGRAVREVLPELEGQGFFELLDGVYRTGEPFFGADMPVMLQRATGLPLEQRFIDMVFMALRDANGDVSGLLVHGVDQTVRKLAEIALYQSRERFEKIVNQAATGVVELDTAGRITFANQRYADMLGYPIDALIGASVADVTAPEVLPATLGAVRKLLDDGIGFVIDKEYLHRDGARVPATSSVNALRGPGGQTEGMVAIVLDTTESKQAALALTASEERYRTLFESMDQGFCVIDMLFDEDGAPFDYRFVEMNDMFELQTGLTDATGKTAKELVPDIDRFWIDTYGRVARTGEAVRFESEVTAIHRWFDVYATRIGPAEKQQVALLFSDISARKASEETQRKLAAELAVADQRKTEFLATLAHELRNPLAPIRSGLGVLRLSGDAPAAVARVREMMERQVGHMVHLIDDLLDIARISGGKLALKKTRADLKAVLGSAVETSLPIIEAGKHALSVDLPDEPLEADVDVTRIAQVVANLLNNAAKYTPPGGRIQLAVVREGMDGVITVSDTGIGIPADALSSVFDMFSQVGRHLDRAQGGLGIGLSLVRRLVEMHGGQVSARSDGPDAGSRFTVRIPLAIGAAPESVAPADGGMPTDANAGLNVLVVDDNIDGATSLSMILEACGHTTRVAHDGLDAMSVLKDYLPDVVLLDIGMPGMNGYETARAIRSLPNLDHVRLVALTGWGAESDRRLSGEAGFDRHLTKPVQLDVLQELLAEIQCKD